MFPVFGITKDLQENSFEWRCYLLLWDGIGSSIISFFQEVIKMFLEQNIWPAVYHIYETVFLKGIETNYVCINIPILMQNINANVNIHRRQWMVKLRFHSFLLKCCIKYDWYETSISSMRIVYFETTYMYFLGKKKSFKNNKE